MPAVVYIDETGDHGMAAIDPNFPIFVLAMFIADITTYNEKIIPAVHAFKCGFAGQKAETVILHSRTIRKAQGDFVFLNDPAQREPFYKKLYELMDTCEYQLITVVIRKDKHKARYGAAARHHITWRLRLLWSGCCPCWKASARRRSNSSPKLAGKKRTLR